MSIIETLVMTNMANPPKFIGTIFISENCPGVFSYDNKKMKADAYTAVKMRRAQNINNL